MKFLGIDYGTKHIGLATSDERGVLAFPKENIANDKYVLEKIGNIITEENIERIVIGESLDFSGMPNKVSLHIGKFVTKLEDKFKLPVHRQNEFLTSLEASKSKTGKIGLNKTQAHTKSKKVKNKKDDREAAALILQRYLDRINNK